MKRESALLLFFIGVTVWQEWRIRNMKETLDVVKEISTVLIEESYQNEVDDAFEEIIENNDLDG
jgi:hypothetical protein